MRSDVSPLHLTYFMLDWNKVMQTQSDQSCTECGKPMHRTEPVIDPKGQKYDGYVCHPCKRVIWLKAG